MSTVSFQKKTVLSYKIAMKNIFFSLEISRKKNSLQTGRDCVTKKSEQKYLKRAVIG